MFLLPICPLNHPESCNMKPATCKQVRNASLIKRSITCFSLWQGIPNILKTSYSVWEELMGKAVGSPWWKTSHLQRRGGGTRGRDGEEEKPSRELFSLEKEVTRNLKGEDQKGEHSFKRETSTNPKLILQVCKQCPICQREEREYNLIHSPDSQNWSFIWLGRLCWLNKVSNA